MFSGEMSETSVFSVCNPDVTPELEQIIFGPFPILFSLQIDERERVIPRVNDGSVPHSPAPVCTNTGQYKMIRRKKSKYDHISLPVVRVLTCLSIGCGSGCGSGEWIEKTRMAEDLGAGSFCRRWYELAEAVDHSSSNGKRGGSGISDFLLQAL